ncbi:cohesin domain-containing protein [Microbacterium sp. RURRCA19A]|uniref:cohesin domain-containing protein n=1 Tax=Microbacterium sp. RURRCA19A TaxID=1907391 RepID=UPI0009704046|nr:cohesin domain-containing protein [Microbacterium sp. RURRCA19A]
MSAAIAAVLALFAPLAAATAAHASEPAATFTLELSSSGATEGDTVLATVSGTDVSDLYAYDLVFTVTEGALASADAPVGPDGGFTSAVEGPGTLTVSHTRLGTSPGLSGTVVLATVPLRAIGSGTARVELTSVRLVSSTGDTAEQTDVASETVELAALPTPEPSASPSDSASPSPSSSSSALPIVSSSGDLATTGVDATPWLISGAVGVALVAIGAVLVARRRQGVRG